MGAFLMMVFIGGGLIVILVGLLFFGLTSWLASSSSQRSDQADVEEDQREAWDFKHLGQTYFEEILQAIPADFSPIKFVWTGRTAVSYRRALGGVRPPWVVEAENGARMTDPSWTSERPLETDDMLQWEFSLVQEAFNLKD